MMEKGELIGQGRTAEVYAWGSDRILKLYQQGFPVASIEHEFASTCLAQAAGIPVPAAEKLIEVEGRCGIIFERLDGISMLKLLSDQPWQVFAAARQLAELHARIHQCTPPPDSFPAQRGQVKWAIEAVKDIPEKVREAALSRLEMLPEGQTFCHGDFHPDNVLITSRGPMIIDWITASRGNPLADVCRTALIFQTSGMPSEAPLHMHLLLFVFRSLIERIYVSRYLQIRPSSRQNITAWLLPLLTARLREVDNFPDERQRILARIQTLLPGSS